jgi:hypothetical protein
VGDRRLQTPENEVLVEDGVAAAQSVGQSSERTFHGNVFLVATQEESAPKGESVLVLTDEAAKKRTPHITHGRGEVNLLCGNCGYVLCLGLENAANLSALVFACPCGWYNRTRT